MICINPAQVTQSLFTSAAKAGLGIAAGVGAYKLNAAVQHGLAASKPPSKHIQEFCQRFVSSNYQSSGLFKSKELRQHQVESSLMLAGMDKANVTISATAALMAAKKSQATMAIYASACQELLSGNHPDLKSNFDSLTTQKSQLQGLISSYIELEQASVNQEVANTATQLGVMDKINQLAATINALETNIKDTLHAANIPSFNYITLRTEDFNLDTLLNIYALKSTLATASDDDRLQIINDFSAYTYNLGVGNSAYQRQQLALKYGAGIEGLLATASFGDLNSGNSIANYFMQTLFDLCEHKRNGKNFSLQEFAIINSAAVQGTAVEQSAHRKQLLREESDNNGANVHDLLDGSQTFTDAGLRVYAGIYSYYQKLSETKNETTNTPLLNFGEHGENILVANLAGGTAPGALGVKNKKGLLYHISTALSAFKPQAITKAIANDIYNFPESRTLNKQLATAAAAPKKKPINNLSDHNELFKLNLKVATAQQQRIAPYLTKLFQPAPQGKNSLEHCIAKYKYELTQFKEKFAKSPLMANLTTIFSSLELMEQLMVFYNDGQAGDKQQLSAKLGGMLNLAPERIVGNLDAETYTAVKTAMANLKDIIKNEPDSDSAKLIQKFLLNFDKDSSYSKTLGLYKCFERMAQASSQAEVADYHIQLAAMIKSLPAELPLKTLITDAGLLSYLEQVSAVKSFTADDKLNQQQKPMLALLKTQLSDFAPQLNESWHEIKTNLKEVQLIEAEITQLQLSNLLRQQGQLSAKAEMLQLLATTGIIEISKLKQIKEQQQRFNAQVELLKSNFKPTSELHEQFKQLENEYSTLYQELQIDQFVTSLSSKTSRYTGVELLATAVPPGTTNKIKEFINYFVHGVAEVEANHSVTYRNELASLKTLIDQQCSNSIQRISTFAYRQAELGRELNKINQVIKKINPEGLEAINEQQPLNLDATYTINNLITDFTDMNKNLEIQQRKFDLNVEQSLKEIIETDLKIQNLLKAMNGKANDEEFIDDAAIADLENIATWFGTSLDAKDSDPEINQLLLKVDLYQTHQDAVQELDLAFMAQSLIFERKQEYLRLQAEIKLDITELSAPFAHWQEFARSKLKNINEIDAELRAKVTAYCNSYLDKQLRANNLDLKAMLHYLKRTTLENKVAVSDAQLKLIINQSAYKKFAQQLQSFYLKNYAKMQQLENNLVQLELLVKGGGEQSNRYGFKANRVTNDHIALLGDLRTRFDQVKQNSIDKILTQRTLLNNEKAPQLKLKNKRGTAPEELIMLKEFKLEYNFLVKLELKYELFANASQQSAANKQGLCINGLFDYLDYELEKNKTNTEINALYTTQNILDENDKKMNPKLISTLEISHAEIKQLRTFFNALNLNAKYTPNEIEKGEILALLDKLKNTNNTIVQAIYKTIMHTMTTLKDFIFGKNPVKLEQILSELETAYTDNFKNIKNTVEAGLLRLEGNNQQAYDLSRSFIIELMESEPITISNLKISNNHE